MDSWVLVADQPRDLVARDLPHVIVSSEDYVARPYMFGGARQKIIILARSYNYQTAAYYCALLAEARGHRVMPSVETMLDLRSRAHYQHALPELEEALNRDLKSLQRRPTERRSSSPSDCARRRASSASRSSSSTGSAPRRSP